MIPFSQRKIAGSVLLLFAALLSLHSPVQAGKGESVIRRVQKKFESVQALSVRFSMHTQATDSSASPQVEGRLFLGAKNCFRLENPSQTLICDGRTVWVYQSQEKQVIIYSLTENEIPLLTPRQLLYDFTGKYDVLNVTDSTLGKWSCDVVVMIPRDKSDPTKRLVVWVDQQESYTRRFLLEDLSGNLVIFDFKDFQTRQNLPDSTFNFVPPAGVEVVDMR